MGASFGHQEQNLGFERYWVEASLAIVLKAQNSTFHHKNVPSLNLRKQSAVTVLIILVASGGVDIVGSKTQQPGYIRLNPWKWWQSSQPAFFFHFKAELLQVCDLDFVTSSSSFWNDPFLYVYVLSLFQDFLPVSQELMSACLLMLRLDVFPPNIWQCQNTVKKHYQSVFYRYSVFWEKSLMCLRV